MVSTSVFRIKKNSYSSVDQLSDILKVSRYKLEKYILELQIDLERIDFEATIELLDTGEIKVHQLTHAIVKRIRLCFVERSLSFQLFHRFIIDETSIDKQIEELHVSRSSTYRLYKRLKCKLTDEGFQIKKNQLIGDESLVRSFLFGLYYEIFNGLSNPFGKKVQQQTQEIFCYLNHQLNLSFPKIREHKLLFFLSIWLIRIRKKHLMGDVIIEYNENKVSDYLATWLDRHFSLTDIEKMREIASLLLFCQMMEIDLNQDLTFIACKENQQAEELLEEFLLYIANHSRFELNRLKEDTELLSGLLRINRKWLIYHFRETTSVTKIQQHYFQGVNPKLDELIQDFIEIIAQRELFHSEQERNKLYYDYLFFLITRISVEELIDPIYICIDFSHGSRYNEYIQTMLRSLQSMNICYEEKLSSMTQVYLSDFLIDRLPCKQVI